MSEENPGNYTLFRSKELAALTNTTVRALRHYIELGLIEDPPRDPNGYRRFTVEHVVRVLRIQQLAEGGMSLAKIAPILSGSEVLTAQTLEDLDQALATKERRLQYQRQALKHLKKLTKENELLNSNRQSRTRQLDSDIDLLVSRSQQLDQDSLDKFRQIRELPKKSEQDLDCLNRFEKLEKSNSISDVESQELAEKLFGYYESIVTRVGLAPVADETSVFKLANQLRNEYLSPAQTEVWNRFSNLVQRRSKYR